MTYNTSVSCYLFELTKKFKKVVPKQNKAFARNESPIEETVKAFIFQFLPTNQQNGTPIVASDKKSPIYFLVVIGIRVLFVAIFFIPSCFCSPVAKPPPRRAAKNLQFNNLI